MWLGCVSRINLMRSKFSNCSELPSCTSIPFPVDSKQSSWFSLWQSSLSMYLSNKVTIVLMSGTLGCFIMERSMNVQVKASKVLNQVSEVR